MPTTSAMDIEYTLETGIMAELVKRTYFATGGAGAGTTMLHFSDNSPTDRPIKYIIVHASPAERLQPNSNFYKVLVSLVSLTHVPNDEARTICRAFYKECLDFVNRFDKSAIGTASGLTVDGFVPQVGSESFGSDNFQNLIASVDVYITKT